MAMADNREITIKVNGKDMTTCVETRLSLGDVLREHFHLTGTLLGCEHGVCGACTVVVDGEPIRSCLMLGVQAHGKRLLLWKVYQKEKTSTLYKKHFGKIMAFSVDTAHQDS